MKALIDLHNSVFGSIERALDPWFMGLFARFVFAGVLLMYFINSAQTKVGDGIAGFFQVQPGAYFQMLPPVVEQFNYDPSQVPLFPYGLIVYMGTYGEFILPILIVIGLFTRISAIGMMIFVAVMTYVDIVFHQVDDKTIGALFDRFQDSAISDQRLLWLFPLIYLVIKGPGLISVDALLGRQMSGDRELASWQKINPAE